MDDKPIKPGSDSSQRDDELIDGAQRQAEEWSPPGGGTETSPAADRDASTPGLRDLAADSFPGFEIVKEVHRGGQGVVYQAVQKTTKRRVAIKVMHEGPFAGSRDKTRFEREVQILAALKHPNIVAIHDSGTAAGHFYYVMDYISGLPLDQYMASGERTIEETLKLFAKICEAVNAAHLKGVIHRDLKPGNIRIDNMGEPHVLDFGLARLATGSVTNDSRPQVMSMTGQFIGSLPWASPEQAEAMPDKIDIRTDVYSLGVILYQMLTGKFPYEVVGNMRDVLDRILKAEPAKPSTIRRQINDEVETIVLKCLQKERERRYQSAGELERDIGRYLAGEPIEAKRDSAWYVLRKQVSQHRVPAAVIAAFVVILSVSTWVVWKQARRYHALALREASAKLEALAARDTADAQQTRAVAAEHAALAEATRAEHVALQNRRVAYDLRIALAQQAWRENNNTRLMQLLNLCPSDLRGWEWNHLRALAPQHTIATAHQGVVHAIGFSSDGVYVFSCGDDGTTRIFEAATGSAVQVLEAPGGPVLCGAFRPDGFVLATGSGDALVRIWNAAAGVLRAELKQHSRQVTCLAFNQGGERLASGDAGGGVTIWDSALGKPLLPLSVQDGSVRALSFSTDGESVVCGTSQGLVVVWNLQTGQETARIHMSESSQGISIALGPDGGRAVSADWHSIRCCDPLVGSEPAVFPIGEPPRWLAPHPGGERVAVIDSSANLTIWDLATGMESLLVYGERSATVATFSPDGRWLAAAARDGTLRLWDGSPELTAPAKPPVVEGASTVDQRWHSAVERGLAWLAAQQASDGSFGGGSHYGPHVGITALAGLAFIGDGNALGRGRFAKHVEGCVRFILDNRSESGLIAGEPKHGPMYGHSFAVVFLAAVYKLTPRDDIRCALQSAVQLIVQAQNSEGGWRYNPVPADADISVTACQVVALRAAGNVGFPCPAETLAKAREFVRSLQNPDGGFRYMQNSGGSALARSAAALAALLYLGEGGEHVSRGQEYVELWQPERNIGHLLYFHYYAAQTMWMGGGDRWAAWWPRARDALVDRQQEDGSWKGQAGDEYGTAISLIVLQFPTGTLPMLPSEP